MTILRRNNHPREQEEQARSERCWTREAQILPRGNEIVIEDPLREWAGKTAGCCVDGAAGASGDVWRAG